jgi:hypothetical protein
MYILANTPTSYPVGYSSFVIHIPVAYSGSFFGSVEESLVIIFMVKIIMWEGIQTVLLLLLLEDFRPTSVSHMSF